MQVYFSAHTWSFADLTLPEALGTIARLGFRFVDIGSGSGWSAQAAANNPRKVAQEIREDLDRYDLTLSDLYLMHPWITTAGERRERDLELFTNLLPFAQALGTQGITVSPGVLRKDDDPEQALALAQSALAQMQASANEQGLALSIEPHLDSVAPNPSTTLKLLDLVDGLNVTLDWAEMTCQNISLDQLTPLLARTRHIHFRGATRNKLQVALEKSTITPETVFASLQTVDYEGAISFELLGQNLRHGAQKLAPISEILHLRDAFKKGYPA